VALLNSEAASPDDGRFLRFEGHGASSHAVSTIQDGAIDHEPRKSMAPRLSEVHASDGYHHVRRRHRERRDEASVRQALEVPEEGN